jgi:hypothetical protein
MVENTLFRQAILSEFTVGGADRMQGGEGTDWMHGGAGDDLMNGNAGNDHMFGGDNADAIWGGPDHDHLWGGNDADYLDVLPREEREVGHGGNWEILPADPLEWFLWAEVDNYQDIDYIYGGWDQDAMQADVADTGPVPGDRLIDWVGAYNIYYLCPPLYGEFVITRALAPGIREFLQDLSASDGAFETAVPGTSGFEELAFVFPSQAGQNSNPPHPDNPGHFTCPVP